MQAVEARESLKKSKNAKMSTHVGCAKAQGAAYFLVVSGFYRTQLQKNPSPLQRLCGDSLSSETYASLQAALCAAVSPGHFAKTASRLEAWLRRPPAAFYAALMPIWPTHRPK